MDRDSRQVLQDLRKEMGHVSSQMSFLKEGFSKLNESFEKIDQEFCFLMDVYEKEQDEVKTRLKRLEDHIGL
jgi:septation ring formation regulator EzrA